MSEALQEIKRLILSIRHYRMVYGTDRVNHCQIWDHIIALSDTLSEEEKQDLNDFIN